MRFTGIKQVPYDCFHGKYRIPLVKAIAKRKLSAIYLARVRGGVTATKILFINTRRQGISGSHES